MHALFSVPAFFERDMAFASFESSRVGVWGCTSSPSISSANDENFSVDFARGADMMTYDSMDGSRIGPGGEMRADEKNVLYCCRVDLFVWLSAEDIKGFLWVAFYGAKGLSCV